MTKQQEISMAVSNAGLVNNENICIKSFGTTFACICKKCTKESLELMDEMFGESKKIYCPLSGYEIKNNKCFCIFHY